MVSAPADAIGVEVCRDNLSVVSGFDPIQEPKRIAFADQLRGFAALLVVLSHQGGAFWLIQPTVAELTGLSPAFPAPPASSLPWAEAISSGLNGLFSAGPAGVALFFLVSGYVIPFSIRKRTGAGFLAARAVRLLPTYWLGFAVQVVVLLAVERALHGHFPRTFAEVVLNLLPGLQLVAWRPSLDGIVWTLDIEVFFYLICAAAAPLIRSKSPHVLLLPAGVALLGGVLSMVTPWITAAPPDLTRAFTGLSLAAPMLVFMFMGTVLHLAEDNDRWRRAAFFLVPLMLAIFAALLRWWAHGALFSQVPTYFMAVALFTLAFILRARIKEWWFSTWLATISYPLYVVHGVSSYALMSLAWSAGWGPLACFSLALSYSVVTAQLLHLLVEKPTMRTSSSLGRRLHDGQN